MIPPGTAASNVIDSNKLAGRFRSIQAPRGSSHMSKQQATLI